MFCLSSSKLSCGYCNKRDIDFWENSHRSATISEELRIQRLMPTVEAIQRSWEDPDLKSHLDSLKSFCNFLGVSEALKYLRRRGASEMDDWSSCLLDEEGKAIRDKITERLTVCSFGLISAAAPTWLMLVTGTTAQGHQDLSYSDFRQAGSRIIFVRSCDENLARHSLYHHATGTQVHGVCFYTSPLLIRCYLTG